MNPTPVLIPTKYWDNTHRDLEWSTLQLPLSPPSHHGRELKSFWTPELGNIQLIAKKAKLRIAGVLIISH